MDQQSKLEMENFNGNDSDDNAFAIISPISTGGKKPFAIEALGDRLIIKEDRMRLGNECKKCDGLGYLEEPCQYCKGAYAIAGETPSEEARICRFCTIERGMIGYRGNYGKQTCPDCKGKGALIVLSQQSDKRPTTGVVVSVGPDVVLLKKGDRVLYAMFAGTGITFRQREKIRVMHEHEVWCKLHGMGETPEMRLL